jgi:hypothetical protein
MKKTGKHPYRPDFSPKLSENEFMEAFANHKDTFKHLRVFMSKSGKTDVGDQYLFLGRNSFGIVQLLDINYQEEKIVIDLLDVKAQRVFRLPIYIHKRGFQGMFWKLDDVRNMINEAIETQVDNHFDEGEYSDKDVTDLLELDETPNQQSYE